MRKVFITIMFVLACSHGMRAQEVTNTEKRYMRAKVFDLLQEYENVSTFYSDNDRKSMLRLFGNETNSLVFMDLMGSDDFRTMVPLEKYLNYITSRGIHPSFRLKLLSVGEVKRKGENLEMEVSFQKSVNYFDEFETFYSSSDYYGSETVLHATFLYNPRRNSCRFVRIDGKIDSSVPDLPEKYHVIKKNTDHPRWAENDELLLEYNGLKPFNAYDQTFCPLPLSSLIGWDDDVTISWDRKARDERYSEVSFNYKFLHYRLKPRVAFAPWMAYSVQGVNPVDNHSSAMEIGVDVGRHFRLSSVSSIGIYTGIAVSFGQLSLKDDEMEYDFTLTDENGSQYRRLYSISSVSTGLKFSDLAIPIYADWMTGIAPLVHLHVNAGIKTYLNMGTKVSPFHIQAAISKVDEQVNSVGTPVQMDQDVLSFLQPISYERAPLDVSFIAGVQLDYTPNLFKKRVSVFSGVGFEQGITQSYRSDSLPYSDASHSIFPLFYDDNLKRDLVFAPMVSGLSYRRKALWIQGGCIIKF